MLHRHPIPPYPTLPHLIPPYPTASHRIPSLPSLLRSAEPALAALRGRAPVPLPPRSLTWEAQRCPRLPEAVRAVQAAVTPLSSAPVSHSHRRCRGSLIQRSGLRSDSRRAGSLWVLALVDVWELHGLAGIQRLARCRAQAGMHRCAVKVSKPRLLWECARTTPREGSGSAAPLAATESLCEGGLSSAFPLCILILALDLKMRAPTGKLPAPRWANHLQSALLVSGVGSKPVGTAMVNWGRSGLVPYNNRAVPVISWLELGSAKRWLRVAKKYLTLT